MVELVTGHAGKAHATAEQAAGLNAGILGLDDYVLNVHDKFKITVVSANKVTIGTGELAVPAKVCSFQAIVPKSVDWRSYEVKPVWETSGPVLEPSYDV